MAFPNKNKPHSANIDVETTLGWWPNDKGVGLYGHYNSAAVLSRPETLKNFFVGRARCRYGLIFRYVNCYAGKNNALQGMNFYCLNQKYFGMSELKKHERQPTAWQPGIQILTAYGFFEGYAALPSHGKAAATDTKKYSQQPQASQGCRFSSNHLKINTYFDWGLAADVLFTQKHGRHASHQREPRMALTAPFGSLKCLDFNFAPFICIARKCQIDFRISKCANINIVVRIQTELPSKEKVFSRRSRVSPLKISYFPHDPTPMYFASEPPLKHTSSPPPMDQREKAERDTAHFRASNAVPELKKRRGFWEHFEPEDPQYSFSKKPQNAVFSDPLYVGFEKQSLTQQRNFILQHDPDCDWWIWLRSAATVCALKHELLNEWAHHAAEVLKNSRTEEKIFMPKEVGRETLKGLLEKVIAAPDGFKIKQLIENNLLSCNFIGYQLTRTYLSKGVKEKLLACLKNEECVGDQLGTFLGYALASGIDDLAILKPFLLKTDIFKENTAGDSVWSLCEDHLRQDKPVSSSTIWSELFISKQTDNAGRNILMHLARSRIPAGRWVDHVLKGADRVRSLCFSKDKMGYSVWYYLLPSVNPDKDAYKRLMLTLVESVRGSSFDTYNFWEWLGRIHASARQFSQFEQRSSQHRALWDHINLWEHINSQLKLKGPNRNNYCEFYQKDLQKLMSHASPLRSSLGCCDTTKEYYNQDAAYFSNAGKCAFQEKIPSGYKSPFGFKTVEPEFDLFFKRKAPPKSERSNTRSPPFDATHGSGKSSTSAESLRLFSGHIRVLAQSVRDKETQNALKKGADKVDVLSTEGKSLDRFARIYGSLFHPDRPIMKKLFAEEKAALLKFETSVKNLCTGSFEPSEMEDIGQTFKLCGAYRDYLSV